MAKEKDFSGDLRRTKYKRDVLKKLIFAAKGIYKASLLIKNVSLVSVSSRELLENISIVVYDKFIVRIIENNKDLDRYIGYESRIIDARGLIATPGFIDAHVHIESSYLSPIEFSKIAVLHGTTTAVADPHEIANVDGLNAMRNYIDMIKRSYIKILLQIPSCVPPVDPSMQIDSPGAVLEKKLLRDLIREETYHSLGEFMDFVSVSEGDDESLDLISETILSGKRVYGHIPSQDEELLDRYILTGVSSCHESVSFEEALEKLRRGLYVMIRQGSSWRDLGIIKDLVRKRIGLDRVMIVTDDINIIDLYEEGYMDYVVREAIQLGLDPIDAVKLATINPATYLYIDDLVGLIAPGRFADIVILRDLEKVTIDTVISNGSIYVYRGEKLFDKETSNKEDHANCLRNCRKISGFIKDLSQEDLVIKLNKRSGRARVRVIKLIPGKTHTRSDEEILEIVDSRLIIDSSRDLVYAVAIDRYRDNKSIGRGFVKGLGLREGAIAMTIAHDTHNILAFGKDFDSMITSLRRLHEIGGGIVVAKGYELLHEVVLDGYGLFSTKHYEDVYREMKTLEEVLRDLGVEHERIFMNLSLISLPVIPDLRLTPRGLVDVNRMRIVDPVIELF